MTTRRPPHTAPPSREPFFLSMPQNLQCFYKDIERNLPSNYIISEKGIAVRSHGAANCPSKPFCSPFRVKAFLYERSGDKWLRLLELVNPRGDLVECAVPSGKLDGKPREAITILSDRGLRVFDDFYLRAILDIIRNWDIPVDGHEIMVPSVGWTPDRGAFISTSGNVINRRNTGTKYRLSVTPDGKDVGSISVWRDAVAAIAVGNVNLIFAISLALSTALMAFTDLGSVVFHLFGRTSKGKTRVLRSALTVWPKIGVKEKTWDATINGLEGELARSSHILLGLDELPKDASADLGNMIYKVSLGAGKARGEKDGSAKKRASWQTAVISTGEHSVLETLRRMGKVPTGGQGVRMIDIPAMGACGVFDNLHGHATSDDFVAALDKSIKRASGPAGEEFVKHLMAQTADELIDRLESDTKMQTESLLCHLGINAGDDATTEIRRVLQSFALIAVAGEWATAEGLTGWAPGVVSDAVRTISQRWLTKRGTMPLDQSEGIQKIRSYIAEHEHEFTHLSAAKSIPEGEKSPRGYQDDEYFYLLPSTMSSISDSKSKEVVLLKYLLDAHFLRPGNEKDSLQFRIKPLGGYRPRTYRICRSILSPQEHLRSENDSTAESPLESI